MKIMSQLSIILMFLLTGEIINKIFHIPIPGSVIGMIFLFLFLFTGILKIEYINKVGHFFLKNLAFFFIPPTVAIINSIDLLQEYIFQLLFIIIFTTVLVMVVTGLTVQILVKWMIKK